MHRSFLFGGALFGGLAVALGAFGAHGLQNITADESILRIFQTSAQYQMYHALALIAVALVYDRLRTRTVKWSGYFFIIGILLFSGSLYAITALKLSGKSVPALVGIITPVGGVCFIAGWLLLLIAASGSYK
jgi:uncharacterized membrane protein YgdD (TMEM256/DUF423 family)